MKRKGDSQWISYNSDSNLNFFHFGSDENGPTRTFIEAMNQLHTAMRKIREKCKHGLLIKALLDKFSRFGIVIRPFYIFKERLIKTAMEKIKKDSEKYQFTELKYKDMKEVSQNDAWPLGEEIFINMLSEGKKCFGIKVDYKLAAFTWVAFDKCKYPGLEMPLKENEAYLFCAYAFKAFRGKKIAPLMRYHCYEILDRMGFDTFYSWSEYFNKPAISFKKKLGAEFIGFGVFINLFGRFKHTVLF